MSAVTAPYFAPYDTGSLVQTLRQMIYADDASAIQASLRVAGATQSARYLPEKILPQWQDLLCQVGKTPVKQE